MTPRSFSPIPRTTFEALGVDARSVTLAAAHEWDLTGARRAGLRAAFVDRGHKDLSPPAETPNFHASDPEDLAMQLIRRST